MRSPRRTQALHYRVEGAAGGVPDTLVRPLPSAAAPPSRRTRRRCRRRRRRRARRRRAAAGPTAHLPLQAHVRQRHADDPLVAAANSALTTMTESVTGKAARRCRRDQELRRAGPMGRSVGRPYSRRAAACRAPPTAPPPRRRRRRRRRWWPRRRGSGGGDGSCGAGKSRWQRRWFYFAAAVAATAVDRRCRRRRRRGRRRGRRHRHRRLRRRSAAADSCARGVNSRSSRCRMPSRSAPSRRAPGATRAPRCCNYRPSTGGGGARLG